MSFGSVSDELYQVIMFLFCVFLVLELSSFSCNMFIHGFAYYKFQIRQALKEQQDVNEGLRGYIDGILMNIMEKYPELLEVRK